ncbi:MAG: Glycosyl transferase, group 1 [Candidatus Gallionella acididurans]|uniref:Glycosyl transferase, group 1 n=1 Tax=Candidatus Gallionella acididurans TaxID=1796491 RepID=A0A139BQ14_9PROT|nr:MAG: Glycosyl transferase, group 1 [Candidatus Gallionella acididurans]
MANGLFEMKAKQIVILGTVGVPAKYGGFETLAENLVKYHDASSLFDPITVYCSSRSYPAREQSFLSAQLKYVPLNANGVQSILYDIVSLFSAVWNRSDVILLLGVSGAIALPLIRLLSSARIVTNIDGIEWRRGKWKGWAKCFLRFSEKMAVRFSHETIADNAAIADYVAQTYGVKSHVIAYGGDHALAVDELAVHEYLLPESYAVSVCRIEPENNVRMVLEAFARLNKQALVMVGNWNISEYGRTVREQYASCRNIILLDSIYDLGKLKYLRSRALLYIHGHSAGGTNPSLVEAMHFGKAVLAFDCNYNRSTTEDKALFFKNSDELVRLIETMDLAKAERVGRDMAEIAERRYTWRIVAQQYFALLGA